MKPIIIKTNEQLEIIECSEELSKLISCTGNGNCETCRWHSFGHMISRKFASGYREFYRWYFEDGRSRTFATRLKLNLEDEILYDLEAIKLQDGFLFRLSPCRTIEENFVNLMESWKILVQVLGGGLIILDSRDKILDISQLAVRLLSIRSRDGVFMTSVALRGQGVEDYVEEACAAKILNFLGKSKLNRNLEFDEIVDVDNKTLRLRIKPLFSVTGNYQGSCLNIIDKTNEIRLAAEVAESRERQFHLDKMASLGQLASGVAHEINTPIQFISANNHFLKEAFQVFENVIEKLRTELLQELHEQMSPDAVNSIETRIKKAMSECDLDFYREEIKSALEQSQDGIERVSSITQAMKSFSHPGTREMQSVSINKLIRDTVTISRNEWKYNSSLDMELDPSEPQVVCIAHEFNQVLLNMVVNSAQAIAEARKLYPDRQGHIIISTRVRDDGIVMVSILDNGIGIPKENISRIYDLFFTTKEVGKGTGQGLYMAYNIITNHHRGKIDVNSIEGEFTEFIISLPRQLEMTDRNTMHEERGLAL